MSNPFAASTPGADGSCAIDMFPVTPDDANDLPTWCRSLLVEVQGTIRVTTFTGNVRNLPSGLFLAGDTVPVAVRRVHATGTTATLWGLV